MLDKKRILIASAFGVITGVVCYLGGRFGLKDQISPLMLVYILVNRTLIGFVIGVSTLRLSWPVHGIVIGLAAGLPFALGCLLEPGGEATMIAALILGAVYGFVIELFTSVVFRLPSEHGKPRPHAAGAASRST